VDLPPSTVSARAQRKSTLQAGDQLRPTSRNLPLEPLPAPVYPFAARECARNASARADRRTLRLPRPRTSISREHPHPAYFRAPLSGRSRLDVASGTPRIPVSPRGGESEALRRRSFFRSRIPAPLSRIAERPLLGLGGEGEGGGGGGISINSRRRSRRLGRSIRSEQFAIKLVASRSIRRLRAVRSRTTF